MNIKKSLISALVLAFAMQTAHMHAWPEWLKFSMPSIDVKRVLASPFAIPLGSVFGVGALGYGTYRWRMNKYEEESDRAIKWLWAAQAYRYNDDKIAQLMRHGQLKVGETVEDEGYKNRPKDITKWNVPTVKACCDEYEQLDTGEGRVYSSLAYKPTVAQMEKNSWDALLSEKPTDEKELRKQEKAYLQGAKGWTSRYFDKRYDTAEENKKRLDVFLERQRCEYNLRTGLLGERERIPSKSDAFEVMRLYKERMYLTNYVLGLKGLANIIDEASASLEAPLDYITKEINKLEEPRPSEKNELIGGVLRKSIPKDSEQARRRNLLYNSRAAFCEKAKWENRRKFGNVEQELVERYYRSEL
jgi:hypothetical protein